MPLECLPVAMLYVPFHRASAYDFEQTSKSRFLSEDVTQSDRFEGLTEVADDSKERLDGGLNDFGWVTVVHEGCCSLQKHGADGQPYQGLGE